MGDHRACAGLNACKFFLANKLHPIVLGKRPSKYVMLTFALIFNIYGRIVFTYLGVILFFYLGFLARKGSKGSNV